jgi:hypothetical protein
VADYFLFGLQKGYCDYYATAMVVMARAAGLPARFVTGYASGSYDLSRAQYIVTEADAHSWVEIYFPDLGWVEFEPTAGLPAIIRAEEGETAPPVPIASGPQGLDLKFILFWRSLLSSVWLSAALAVLLALLWIGTDSLRLMRLDPTEAIRRIYQRLRRLARPLSGATPMDQTAHEYASALIAQLDMLASRPRSYKWLTRSKIEINTLTEFYSRSLFAPFMPTYAEIRGAIKIWSHLRLRVLLADILIVWSRGIRSRLK